MSPYPFTLIDFIRESNRIEGIHREPTEQEVVEMTFFLGKPGLRVVDLEQFVSVYQPGAVLRTRVGCNVRVGTHIAPPGGPDIALRLQDILNDAHDGKARPYEAHQRYEHLHPFSDGNGRSGRALWLWMMGGIDRAPLGFLHHWYYESLRQWRGE